MTQRPMSDLLTVENLHAGYGAIEVLHGVSLRVGPGEAVGVIGANGAGKSTLLGAITGLVRPRAGRIANNGHDRTATPAHAWPALGMALVPEGRRIFPRLTVVENLRLGAYSRRDVAGIAADLERQYEVFPRLAERRRQLGGTLSGGEQQMLAIARALMSRPRLLLLDEPSMGVSPVLTDRIYQVLAELRDQGLSLLLVEQDVHRALALTARTYVLETGRVVAEGASAALAQDPRIRAAYLGG